MTASTIVIGWAPAPTSVLAASPGFPPVTVYVGYADDLRSSPFFPNPWSGSSNTVFVGSGSPFDAGAVRIDNPSGSSLTVDRVTVDVGASTFSLWGSQTIPGNGTLIVTQTTQYDFDTSDLGPPGCTNNGTIPIVHVTINGITTNYNDTRQVLNTNGMDLANCPPGTNESHQWQQVGGGPSPSETRGGSNPSEHQTLCHRAGPVNCVTGEFWHAFVDLEVSGRGLPLVFARTYSAMAAGTHTRVGFGWTDNYNMFLTTEAGSGNVTVTQENGSTVTFTPTPTGYQAPSRVLATLARSADGTQFTFTRQSQTRFIFDAATGWLLKQVDLNGYATVLGYNGIGQLTTITDPAGRKLSLTYTGPHVTGISDPIGRSVHFTYSASNDLVAATDVGAKLTSFTYDANHLMTSMTDPSGGVTQNTFDSSGRVVSQSDPMLRTTSFRYDASSTTITDAKGNQTVEQYQNNELVAITEAFGTAQTRTWALTYDPNTLGITTITDPLGRVSTNTWDASGNLASTSDPLGRTARFTYDGFNHITSVTDPDGGVVSYTYDSNGNLTSASRPLVATGQTAAISYGYDPAHPGDVITATDQLGKVYRFTYDPTSGDNTRVTDPLANTDSFTYDAIGGVVSAVSPKGNLPGANPGAYTTTFSLDAFGAPLAITNPLGQKTQFQWDANRNLLKLLDANGRATSYAYDRDNEVVSVTRADGSVVQDVYDANGNVTAEIDPLGNATTFAYDPLNRLTSVTDPLGRPLSFGYDAVGNLVTRTDPAGQITAFSYDAANQQTGIAYTDGKTANVSFAYDRLGRRTRMTDGTGVSSYAWDALGRLTQHADGAGRTARYGYNLRGDLTTVTYPDLTSVQRSFDDAARLVGITDWAGRQTQYGYDANSNVTAVGYPNGVRQALAYDNADQLASIGYSGPMGAITFTYGRDATGQLTSENVVGAPPNSPVGYGYDSANRVTSANYGFTQQTYKYDGADHVVQSSVGRQNTAFAYDKADQLLSKTVTQDGGPVQKLQYTYDANGNRVKQADQSGRATTFTYDQANRLTDYSGRAQYSYNGDGLSTGKTVAGTPQAFTWDVADGMPLLLQDGATKYVAGLGGLPLEQVGPDGTVRYYHQDQLGSTRALTNASGRLDAVYAYDPYGNSVSAPANIPNPFQFAGEYTHAESGLQYMRARYYDPTIAQFITRDPLALTGAPAYAYGGDNPLNIDDPLGLGSASGSRPGGPLSAGACAVIGLLAGAGEKLLGGAHDLADGAKRAASTLGRTLRRGSASARSMAAKWLPKAGRFAKSPFFRGLRAASRAVVVVGGVLTFVGAVAEGDSVGRAAARAVGATVGGFVGAGLGAAACGALAGISAGIGAASCFVLVPLGGFAGSVAGEWLGGFAYDHAPAVVTAVGGWVSGAGSALQSASHAVSGWFSSGRSLVPWFH